MSTATPPLRTPSTPAPQTPASRPGPAPGGGGPGLGALTIDPVRLLKRYYPLLIGAAVLGGVLGTVAHFVLLKYRPSYTSTATFECLPQVEDITKPGTGSTTGQGDFDRFMGTQMSLMTSYNVIMRAVQSPDVAQTRWAQQFVVNGAVQPTKAHAALTEALSPRPVPTTNLIRLSMTWRRPDDVRTIVEAVTDAYMEDVRTMSATTSVARREILDRQRKNLVLDIERVNRLKAAMLQSVGVTDLGDNGSEEVTSRESSNKLIEIEQALASRRSMVEKFETMLAEGAVIQYTDDMMEEAKRHPIVLGLLQRLSDLETDETSLRQRYLDGHPDLIRIRQQINATKQQLAGEMDKKLREIFDAQLDSYKTEIRNLESQRAQLTEELKKAEARKADLLRARIAIDEWDLELTRLNNEVAALNQAKANLDSLNDRIFDRVRVAMRAQTPNQVSFPKLEILLPIGVLLMTGLVGGVVLLREIMDQRVRGPADLAMIPRLRVLGMIPDAAEDPSKPVQVETAFRDTPGGVVTESFRQLRAPLMKKMDQEGLRTLLVLAGMPGSGATTVLSNLALASAATDERVLVIDGNLRRPGLHKVFGAGEGLGLGDCLAGQAGLDQAVRPSSVPNLFVLTAGSPGNRMVPERLGAESMSRLLAEAAGKFDRVFIDAPPAIVSGDGMAIANRCDGVLLVVRALQEKRGLVNRLRAQLGETHAVFLGAVINAVRPSAGGYFKGNIKATHEYQTKGR